MRGVRRCILFCTIFLTGFLILGMSLRGHAQDQLIFADSWIPIARISGFYVALEQGLYRERGLSVSIQRGWGSGDTVKRVAAGAADFGFADAGSLIVGRSRGAWAMLVGMFHAKSLMAVFFLKDSGIQKPKDLEGRTIGDAPGAAVRIIFPAFAAATGIDVSKIREINIDVAIKHVALVTKKVDAVTTMTSDLPTILDIAKKAGVEVKYFLYPDYGVDVYSNGVFTRDENIRSKPDLVRRFVHASYHGIAWAVENPEGVVRTFLKYNPTANPELTRAEWEIAVDHLLTEEALKNGIGYMDPEKMKRTRDMITTYMKLERVVPLEEIYTNEFLPKLFPKRP